ncbi:hypothetical protein L2E82_40017 [Cichorium intybus]|uniref:Uncharacterized protein n=1 Tax=Cichorium intybus TaxID=13427 RepID=A0ACB9AJV0_CICIN|nr:hypothetical protein L2E82_40017 [Cichorium intybus]
MSATFSPSTAPSPPASFVDATWYTVVKIRVLSCLNTRVTGTNETQAWNSCGICNDMDHKNSQAITTENYELDNMNGSVLHRSTIFDTGKLVGSHIHQKRQIMRLQIQANVEEQQEEKLH